MCNLGEVKIGSQMRLTLLRHAVQSVSEHTQIQEAFVLFHFACFTFLRLATHVVENQCLVMSQGAVTVTSPPSQVVGSDLSPPCFCPLPHVMRKGHQFQQEATFLWQAVNSGLIVYEIEFFGGERGGKR